MALTILVPLDGSPLAEQALPYASTLARTGQARVILVRATLAHALPGLDSAKDQLRGELSARDYLATVAGRLMAQGIEVETANPPGDAAEKILEQVRIWNPDLVVMATHGRGGLAHMIYGSVTQAVLAQSPVPVLLVRAGQPERLLGRLAGVPRILVPLSGTETSEAVLPMAARLVDLLDGELVLLRAVTIPEPPASMRPAAPLPVLDGAYLGTVRTSPAPEGFSWALWEDGCQRDAREYLERIADRLTAERPGRRVLVEVRSGSAKQAIGDVAETHKVALVAMPMHSYNTTPLRPRFGEVTRHVLHHDGLPLLLVRSPAT
jgi:nucleotide-binding universal stress UspA family protein